MERRKFIQNIALAGAALSFNAEQQFTFLPKFKSDKKKCKIGWITDLHHGYCADASQRLGSFIEEVAKQQPEFIIQGGDFCHPTPEADEFLAIWNQYNGEKHHVLGNHDMDKGTKADIMQKWGMKEAHYTFIKGNFQFVVLDCNYILKDNNFVDYAKGNFYIDAAKRDLINPEQIIWLEKILDESDKQCIIISHQSLDEVWTGFTIPNRKEVRNVLESANKKAGYQKVIACICGHHHLDHHMVIEGIHYLHINSASYYYVGDGFGSDGAKAMYSAPLFCFVTLDPSGKISIKGRQAKFLSPTPKEKNYPNADKLSAAIEDALYKFY